MKFENMLKTSVEKEKVNMCGALEELYNDGVNDGIEQGMNAFVEACKELEISKETICQKLQDKFSLSEERAKEYMEKYQF